MSSPSRCGQKLKAFLLIISLLPIVSCLPSQDCSVEGEHCQLTGNNVLHSVGLDSLEMCRDLCKNESSCSDLTFFGPNSFPLKNFCFIYSECPTLQPCTDCYTEEAGCNQPCSVNFEGIINSGNFIGLVEDVVSEDVCKTTCQGNNYCKFYTYYDEEHDVDPNTCFLLNEEGIHFPMAPCESCHSGPVHCSRKQQPCSLAFLTIGNSTDGLDHLIFTSSSEVSFVSGEKGCIGHLRVAGTGGGGGVSVDKGGGGGSGQVAVIQDHPQDANTDLSVEVGLGGIYLGGYSTTNGEPSRVLFNGDSIFEALGGEKGTDSKGGDGYSGGGGGSL